MGIKVHVILYKEKGKQKVALRRDEKAAEEFLRNRKGRIIASNLDLDAKIYT